MVSRPTNGLSLCAGAGGLDMGLMLAEPGFHTRCFVEWEEYPRQSIIAAQRAGYFAPAPIWDDVTTFDGRPLRGAIDTILAGYPCQPFSQAGQRKGADDERHLWPDVARIIREIEPEWVFLENVLGHVSLGLETVLRELWDMGYTPAVGIFSAEEVGSTHERQRVFIVANSSCRRRGGSREGENQQSRGVEVIGSGAGCKMDDATGSRCNDARIGTGSDKQSGKCVSSEGRCTTAHASGAELEGIERSQRHQGGWQEPDGYPALQSGTGLFPPGPNDSEAWQSVLAGPLDDHAPALGVDEIVARAIRSIEVVQETSNEAFEPIVRRVANGLAIRSRALRLLGNGVCPLAAAYAWRSLAASHGLRALDLATACEGKAARANEHV
jgi:DNA (cytosine-5)-methyltransferase 1